MNKIPYVGIFFIFSTLAWAGSADPQVEKILEQYFQIHDSLAKDSTEGVDDAAKRIAELARDSGVADPQAKKVFADLGKASRQIQGKNLKEAREHFFELSKPLLLYLNQSYSGKKEYYRYFCSMAKKGWIQRAKEVRNPYYGSQMLTCGDLIP